MTKKQREEVKKRMAKWREECEKITANKNTISQSKKEENYNGKTENDCRAN